MSITDELRSWVAGAKPAVINGCEISVGPLTSGCRDALTAIANRIDVEHERLMQEQPFTIDMVPMTDENMAEHGWIRLPVDADGEYIRAGDVLDGYGKTIEVVELRYGRSGWVLISRDGNGYADTFAFTHHHAPTVEDVLREFADEVQRCCDTEDTIAEYAAKLRLAGDE